MLLCSDKIALLMAELPVDEPDPRVRLERVRATMECLKSSRQALGAEVLSAVSEWTSATLLSLAVPNQGLGVGLFSYAGTLGWGSRANARRARRRGGGPRGP